MPKLGQSKMHLVTIIVNLFDRTNIIIDKIGRPTQ